MGLLDAPAPGGRSDLPTSARQLEAMFLQKMLTSSGAFKGSASAGGQIYSELFAGALADAVEKSGGIGLAGMVEQSLGGTPSPAPTPAPPPSVFQPLPTPTNTQPTPALPAAQTRPPPPSIDPNIVEGGVVTSGFGARRDPFDGHVAQHQGVDIAAPEGTPIRAFAGGVVVSAGPKGGYGNAVVIDNGLGVTTLYGHASEVEVQPGQIVTAGQEIAQVGQTGRATGPHVHFELREGGSPIDASRVLKVYGARVENLSDTVVRGPP